jgi:LacI family transcriptional regulator
MTPMAQRQSSGSARLEDVAEAAGVHVSTVSRVLNGRAAAMVRPETRLRIEEAAAQLRYRPNAIARGLKLASAGALGLLVPSLRNPVYSAIIRGAFDRAWERRFVVLLAEDTGASSAQQAYERLVHEGRIDGLLIASARPGSPLFDNLMDDPIPCVFVNRRHLASGRNASMREEDAGRLAAEHLLGLGHTRLAHISGPAELDTAQRRAEGFVQVVRAAGHRCSVVAAPFDERGGMSAMRELLGRRVPPTGVFASNINQAVGAIAGARLASRSIPGELSLVGYDDDPLCECLEVPLTAIKMPLAELGRVAVDALIDQVEGAVPRDITVETAPELVLRGSTAPPGARR